MESTCTGPNMVVATACNLILLLCFFFFHTTFPITIRSIHRFVCLFFLKKKKGREKSNRTKKKRLQFFKIQISNFIWYFISITLYICIISLHLVFIRIGTSFSLRASTTLSFYSSAFRMKKKEEIIPFRLINTRNDFIRLHLYIVFFLCILLSLLLLLSWIDNFLSVRETLRLIKFKCAQSVRMTFVCMKRMID